MIPVKVKAPVSQKKITNVSKRTTQVVLSFKDNMQCKEGIFIDILGEKLTRNKEKWKHLATNSARLPRFVAELVYPGNERGLRVGGVGPLPAGIYPQLGELYPKTTLDLFYAKAGPTNN